MGTEYEKWKCVFELSFYELDKWASSETCTNANLIKTFCYVSPHQLDITLYGFFFIIWTIIQSCETKLMLLWHRIMFHPKELGMGQLVDCVWSILSQQPFYHFSEVNKKGQECKIRDNR